MNSPVTGVGITSNARKESSRPVCGRGVTEEVSSILREMVCMVVRGSGEWCVEKLGGKSAENIRARNARQREHRKVKRERYEREQKYRERQRRQRRSRRGSRSSDDSGKWLNQGTEIQVPKKVVTDCIAADTLRMTPVHSRETDLHATSLLRELGTYSVTPDVSKPGESSCDVEIVNECCTTTSMVGTVGAKVNNVVSNGNGTTGEGMPLDEWASWQPGNHGREETNEEDLALGFKYVDLFSGIGCAGLALTPLNCECVMSCECDADALVVQKRHYCGKIIERFESVTVGDLNGAEVAFVSCPCQSYSLAGKQRGVRDERGTYMFRSADLLARAQVPVMVFEMVPHFVKVERGAVTRAFVRRLEERGYRVYSQVLNAIHYDAPQYRERVFFVCVKAEVVQQCGEWTYPVPDPTWYVRPVSTVLDSEFKSAQTVKTVRVGVRWHAPVRQVDGIGSPVRVGRVGVGSRTGNYIHSVDHPICTQKSSSFSEGAGGTSGLVSRQTRYGPRVTKLSVREVCRCMQVPDWLEMPEGDVGYRLAGNGVCCGVLRALGRALKTYLNPRVVSPAHSLDLTLPPPCTLHTRVLPALDKLNIDHDCTSRVFERELCLEVLRQKVSVWCGEQWWYQCRIKSLEKAVASMNVPTGLSDVLVSEGRSRVRGWCYGSRQQLLWWEWDSELWAELRDGALCPLISEVPAYNGRNYPSADHPKVTAEFERMVQIGAFEYVPRSKIKVITPIAAIPKADFEVTGKIRIIVDFSKSPFNDNVRRMPFILPSFDDFLNEVSCNDWIGLVDFSDGFYQFPVDVRHRELLGVRLPCGKLGRFTGFPFGTRCSPWVFCRFVSYFQRQVEKEYCGKDSSECTVVIVNDPSDAKYDPTLPILFRVRKDGSKLATFTIFVDDAAICAPSKSECERAMRVYLRVAARYGLRVNHGKTIHPTQTSARFQGFIVNTVADSRGIVVTVPPEKLSVAVELVQNMKCIPDRGVIVRRDLASLIGKLSHLTTVVKYGRAYVRRMYDCVHNISDGADAHDYDQSVVLSDGARKDLAWWQEHLPLVKSSLVWSSRVVTLKRQWTDASGKGWGYSKVKSDGTMRYRHGLWPSECGGYSSNARELKTILLAVSASPEEFTGCEVHTYTDNAVSESCINHSTSTAESLMVLVREFVRLQMLYDFRIVAHWVPGNRGPRSMVKQGTDGLSRGSIGEGAIGGNVAPLHFMPPSPCDPVPVSLVRELCGDGEIVSTPCQWHEEVLCGVWCPPPALVRRAMSVYLGQKLRMPDLCSARFVVYDCDTDPWWRWTRAGRHFRVTQRVSAQSEHGMLYALPHDVLVLESPFGFWTDTVQ